VLLVEAIVWNKDRDPRLTITMEIDLDTPLSGPHLAADDDPCEGHVDGCTRRGTGSNHITLNWPSGVQELFDAQGWSATNDPYGLDSRGEGVPTPETYQRAMRKRQVWVEQLLAVPELGLG
jgi:hypothetical protein